jgi:large subunit ribosomal protein L7Ae
MVEVSKELVEKIYKLVESVKVDGKLRKGTNETTKAVEKGEAQLVIVAEDISPKEIVMHFPILCEEKSIPFVGVPSKSELGAAAGMPIPTSSLAIVNPGDAKKQLLDVIKDIENLIKAESKGSKEEKSVDEKPTEKAPTTEQSSAEPKGKAEEKKEEPAKEEKEEPKVEEKAPVKETVIEEPKQEEAPVEESKSEETETPAEEAEAVEEKPAETATEEEPKQEEAPVEKEKPVENE